MAIGETSISKHPVQNAGGERGLRRAGGDDPGAAPAAEGGRDSAGPRRTSRGPHARARSAHRRRGEATGVRKLVLGDAVEGSAAQEVRQRSRAPVVPARRPTGQVSGLREKEQPGPCQQQAGHHTGSTD
eukprot:gene9729-biopygen7712